MLIKAALKKENTMKKSNPKKLEIKESTTCFVDTGIKKCTKLFETRELWVMSFYQKREDIDLGFEQKYQNFSKTRVVQFLESHEFCYASIEYKTVPVYW